MLFSFLHHIKFDQVDPMDGWLRDEIEAERREPEAIRLDEPLEEDSLNQYLNRVVDDEDQSL